MRHARLRSRQLSVVVTGMVLTAAALAGCSGAGGDGGEPVAEPAPAVSIPADLSMGVEGEPARSKAATPSPSPSGGASAPATDQCAELQQAWATTNRALVSLSADHPRALVQSFRTAEHSMDAAQPPDEVAKAWGTMADYLSSAVTAFDDVDEDDANAVSSAIAGAIDADDTATAAAAAKDVTSFLSTSCNA